MKKTFCSIITTATLLIVGSVFSGCSNSSDEPVEPVGPVGPKTYTITVQATKGGSAKTRHLEDDENGHLIATWNTNEEVFVKNGSSWCEGSLKPQTSEATATLSGTIKGTFSVGNSLTFQFPRKDIDYTGQIGTLDGISANYDYSVATAQISDIKENVITVANYKDFNSQQAIVKFILKDSYGYSIKAKSLKISATGLKTSDTTTGDITVTPVEAADVLYVALSGISGTTISLTAITLEDTYIYEKSNVTFVNGQYYEVTVKMKSAMLTEPLTFEAVNSLTTITFHNNLNTSEFVEYRLNSDETWEKYSDPVTLKNAGDKIRFRGNNNCYNPGSDASFFSFSNDCYVYGNIMSLISADDFSNSTVLDFDYNPSAFRELFKNNENLLSHSEKALLLPATTLSPYCYQSMFEGCTGLTRAPVLPAPTLATSCYYQMFKGCSNLNYIKCLAKAIPDGCTGCTTNWVEGVQTTSGTFVSADGVTWPAGESGNPWWSE